MANGTRVALEDLPELSDNQVGIEDMPELSDEQLGVTGPAGAHESTVGRLKVTQTQHPAVKDMDRLVVEAFSSGDTRALTEFFQKERGLEVSEQDGQMVVKKPDEKDWLVVDPDGYLQMGIADAIKEGKKDIVELSPSVLRGVGEALTAQKGAEIGARVGSRFGPAGMAAGTAIGAGVGGAAAGAGLELGGQTVAKMYGVQEEYDPLRVGMAAAGGAAPMAVEGLVAGTKVARSALRDQIKKRATTKAPESTKALAMDEAKAWLSGVPVDVIQDTKKFPRRYLKLEQDLSLKKKKGREVGKAIVDMAHRERKKIGDDIGNIIKQADEAGATVSIAQQRAALNQEIQKVQQQLTGPFGSDAHAAYLDELQELNTKIFSRRMTDEEGNVVYQALPDDIPASIAKDKTDALRNFVNFKQSFAQKAESQAKSEASENIGSFAGNVRAGLKEQMHGLDPRYTDLDEAYGEAVNAVNVVEKNLKIRGQIDAQRSADALRHLESTSKESFSEVVNRLANPKEIKKINRAAQDLKNQIYLRNPSLQAVSTGGSTSTSASGAAREVGETVGALAGSAGRLGYAGIVGLRKAGGLLMQRAHSPAKIRAALDKRRGAAVRKRQLREAMRKYYKPTLYGTSTVAPKLIGDKEKEDK